jgi:hypothetical protein
VEAAEATAGATAGSTAKEADEAATTAAEASVEKMAKRRRQLRRERRRRWRGQHHRQRALPCENKTVRRLVAARVACGCGRRGEESAKKSAIGVVLNRCWLW